MKTSQWTGSSTLRVVLIDHRTIFRSGLRALLEEEPDIRVVAESGSAAAMVDVMPRTRPDVALMRFDLLSTDDMAAAEASVRAFAAGPQRLVVYSALGAAEHVDAALRNGARGFLLAEERPALMVEAVRAAAAGEVLLSPALITVLLGRMPAPPAAASGRCPLSVREAELVCAVALGMTNAEISAEIHMSLSTVKHHLTAVLHKLQLRNRVEIATWAWRAGLMSGTAHPSRRSHLPHAS